MFLKHLLIPGLLLIPFAKTNAQQPRFTPKKFVNYKDEKEFKVIRTDNGIGRAYILTDAEIWDTDDDNTTHFRGGSGNVLIRIEGLFKKGKKDGLFTSYIMDSADHSKLFKIWEQQYSNDKMNGEWRFFNIKGTLVRIQNFKNDSLHGSSRTYLIDGKTTMEERIYSNGARTFVDREFYKNGKIKSEINIVHDTVIVYVKEYYESGNLESEVGMKQKKPDGLGKRYYEDAIIQEETFFLNGVFDGTRKYFHPNGQVWIEQVYKEGKPWTVIANYDDKGRKRDAGSLKDGNGTVIFYKNDGTIRETVTYVNGERTK